MGTAGGGRTLTALRKAQAFNRRALFVIVPGFDHDKGKRVAGVEIPVIEVKRILEGLPTATLHVTVQAPFCSRIVEAGPRCTDGNFIGMLVSHVFVEIVQVLLSPVVSVWGPSLLSRLHPGI